MKSNWISLSSIFMEEVTSIMLSVYQRATNYPGAWLLVIYETHFILFLTN
jgi:hypothetical protein